MAAGPDLEREVRELATQWMAQARELKASPDPASLDHTRASVMESCAAMLRNLLNITSTGEHIDHAAAAARAAAEGLAGPVITGYAEARAEPPPEEGS